MSERLPKDATLVPLKEGALLVSRDLAVFCRIPPGELFAVEAALARGGALEGLSGLLRDDLEAHGFFGPPREPEEDVPSVQIQLTNACNLTCRYCCTNSEDPRPKEVTYEQLVSLLPQIHEAVGPKARVGILGGEPLLVPWSLDLAEKVLDHGYDLTFFTNGVLLSNPELAQRVAALSIRGAEIRVSLSGPTEPLADDESGAPRWEPVLRGLEALHEAGGRAVLDLMLLPGHVDAVAAALPSLRMRLPPSVRLTFGVLYHSGRESGAHLFPSAQALQESLDRISLFAGERIPATPRAPVAHRREGCGCAMGHHLAIRSDGALFNCFKMEEQVGHLAKDDLIVAARRLQAAPGRAVTLPTCADCPLATLCGGGCRSENLIFTGDPGKPPCGPWRVQLMAELLADGQVDAMDWPIHHLLAEAHRRGIEAPERILPVRPSSHMLG
ncbi:MAG: radical SAM protein [Polyangia bacterium]|jgi:radical SAM protein with 4Fe4S-binding SPASM domain|nr:radical SAM protein [Polyangia bacterium]